MAENVIDSLGIEITSDLKSSVDNVRDLSAKLKALKDVVADVSAVNKSNLKNITRLAEALDNVSKDKSAKNLSTIVSRLRSLSNLDTGKLRSVAAELENIIKLIQSMDAGLLKNIMFLKALEQAGYIIKKTDPKPVTKKEESVTESVAEDMGEVATEAKTAITEVDKAMDSVKKETEKTTKALEEVGKVATKSMGKIQKLFRAIARIAMYRAIRYVLKTITNAFKEGIQNVYQYSKAVGGPFAQAMDQIATANLYLKNSIGALSSVLMQALAPVIDIIVDKLVSFLNVINQVLSALAGKSTWTRAIKYPTEWAAGATKAAAANKKLQRTLMGFDELNVLSDPATASGVGGGGGLNYSEMFETVEIEDKWKKVAEIFKKIWEYGKWIAAALLAWKIGKSVLTFFGLLSGKAGGGLMKMLSPKSVLQGILDFAIIVGGITILVTAIGLLMKIPGFEKVIKDGIKAVKIVFQGLFEAVIPLLVFSTGIILLGNVPIKQVSMGLANFAIIVGGLELLILATGALLAIPVLGVFMSTGIENLITVFKGLEEIALPLGGFAVAIIGLGFATPGLILAGILGFYEIVLGLELLLAVLGGLGQIPGFTWLIGEGGKVLAQLGEILGDFVGSIVKGFLETASDALPTIGKNLTAFMDEAMPFFESVAKIDDKTMKSVGYLAESILMLSVSELITGITSWLTGGDALKEFGESLVEFAPSFATYAEAIKDIDADVVEKTSNAIKSVMEFVQMAPTKGGLMGLFTGENLFAAVGAALPGFAENMVKYSDHIKGVDSDVIERTSKAITSVMDYIRLSPHEGGIKQLFTGENMFQSIGAALPGFGYAFLQYSDYMKGVDSAIVERTSQAVTSVMDFINLSPYHAGIKQMFKGQQSISILGAELVPFGESFVKYSESMKKVDAGIVMKSSKAVESIMEYANNVPPAGGVASWFTGNTGLDKFGEKLAAFGKQFYTYHEWMQYISVERLQGVNTVINGIVDFANRIKNTDTSVIENFGMSIKLLAEYLQKLPTTKNLGLNVLYSTNVDEAKKNVARALGLPGFPSLRWYAYAQGGLPDVGEFFVAREAGPELVGRMGSQTAVANNEQIVDGIAYGVERAMRAVMGEMSGDNRITVKIGEDTLIDKVVSGINRKSRITGQSVITV